MIGASMPVLAAQRVRYVGEPVAIVVAETAAQAQDAAEAVALDVDELPSVSDVERATAAGAPAIWDEAPGNVCLDWNDGDAAAVEAAFASAAHVARVRLLDTRVAVAAMEPRAAIGAWDAASGRYTLTAGTQGVALVRKMLAESVFKVPPQQIRVLTHDVGGGFGMKVQVYPEYAAILYAAKRIGRPVKWCDSRLESFLADTPGRDGMLEGELALDADGKFLALRVRTIVGIGAYTSHVLGDLRDHQHEELPVERVRHPGDRHRREDGADERDAARTVPRRRPAGGDLPDRAADRRSRRARPGSTA